MSPGDRPPILALVRDLLFASRITATAKAVNSTVRVIRDPARLAGEPGRRLLVDLSLPGALEAAAAWLQAGGPEVVGFVSHVDADTARAAREAGLTQVLSRGAFTNQLAELVR
jgi:hypothetical protein